MRWFLMDINAKFSGEILFSMHRSLHRHKFKDGLTTVLGKKIKKL